MTGARQLMGCRRRNPFIPLLKRQIMNAVNIKIPQPYGGINYDLSVLITSVMENPDGLWSHLVAYAPIIG
jgi:hypothetical protein